MTEAKKDHEQAQCTSRSLVFSVTVGLKGPAANQSSFPLSDYIAYLQHKSELTSLLTAKHMLSEKKIAMIQVAST